MRGLNLVCKKAVSLQDWHGRLMRSFPSAWIDHCEALARCEGQAAGELNELGVEDGGAYVGVSERPTTIREFEPDELEALRIIISEPKQFFAVDYTDDSLLRRVLTVLLECAGSQRIAVEDERGNVAWLEDFLGASSNK